MEMDKQEVFEYVVKHLFVQGKRASNNQGGCKYLTDDGLKCAVGCLIPTEIYDPLMELSGNIRNLITDFGPILPKEIKRYSSLLFSLQIIHDSSEYWVSEYVLKQQIQAIADANTNKLDTDFMKDYYFGMPND